VSLGRILIIAGGALVVLGVLFVLGERLPFKPGQLPGDIVIRGRNSTFYFPIVTCVLISLLLTGIMWLFGRRG
jgi:hypothetical protein